MEEVLSDELRLRKRRGYNDPYADGVRCNACRRNIKTEEFGQYTYISEKGKRRCSECHGPVRFRARRSSIAYRNSPKCQEFEAKIKRY